MDTSPSHTPFDPFSAVLGESAVLQEALAMARTAAAGLTPVLIEGEAGTGKELIARGIHAAGSRREGPFVACTVEAIPPDQLDEALFGAGENAGAFQRAQSGTLYVNGIGRLPLAVQARMLQELETPPPSPSEQPGYAPLPARLLAGTSQSLTALIARGEFREDLFYRLSAFTVMMPALRDRTDDIPLLAHAFVQLFQRDTPRPARIRGIHPEAISRLQAYPWPGNLRELRITMQRAVVVEESAVLTTASLLRHVAEGRPAVEEVEDARAFDPTGSGTWTRPDDIVPFSELERLAIESAMRVTRGNIQEAAKRLGIGRATLYRKLRKYQDDDDSRD